MKLEGRKESYKVKRQKTDSDPGLSLAVLASGKHEAA